jgi:hypothetical protein
MFPMMATLFHLFNPYCHIHTQISSLERCPCERSVFYAEEEIVFVLRTLNEYNQCKLELLIKNFIVTQAKC